MKTTLLIILFFCGLLSADAQTTHELNWFAGIGTNVDLTIESGDIVRWTWTSPSHTVENVIGSSAESFNSGVLVPVGSTFSHTFTVLGTNDYFCRIHGAASMSGTITVMENLNVEQHNLKLFSLSANPVSEKLIINLPQIQNAVNLTIYDLLGKNIYNQTYNHNHTINIDVSDLSSGVYLITIESDSKKQTQRFVKI